MADIERLAGHRIDEPHDCFTMNCKALGVEVLRLRDRLAALQVQEDRVWSALEELPRVALEYPKGPAVIDHDDDCAFIYGNQTYPCRCFVSGRAVLGAALAFSGNDPTEADELERRDNQIDAGLGTGYIGEFR